MRQEMMVPKETPAAGGILQGTLDMFSLRTLVMGPAHSLTHDPPVIVQSEIEQGSLILRSTASKTAACFPRSGASAKITAGQSFTVHRKGPEAARRRDQPLAADDASHWH